MTGDANSDRELSDMTDRDRPEPGCRPPVIVMANFDTRQAARTNVDSAGFGDCFLGRPQSSKRKS